MLSPLVSERRFVYPGSLELPERLRRVQCAESPTMEIGEKLHVTTPQEFRRWLQRNHAAKREIWLVRYKKATGKPSIDYVEAVEEAICFGWIDGLEKSIDAERYATRFSPRRPRSNWTAGNLERARRMIEAGKMMPAGTKALPEDPARSRPKGTIKRKSPTDPFAKD